MDTKIIKKEKKSGKGFLDKSIALGGISLKDKAIFTRNLSIMLKSGLSLGESLDILAEQASGKLRKIIESIRESSLAGNPLSNSFGKFPRYFSSFFVNTVRAGESSGNLEENLGDIARKLSTDNELYNKIKTAMFYPLIVLALSLVVGLSVAFFILPKITPIFSGLKVELPVTTRFLIWFSENIVEYGLFLFLGIIFIVLGFIWLIKRKWTRPFFHLTYLKIPIVKTLTRNKNLALFSSTLGTLIKSGLTIDESLKITADSVSNYYYKKSVLKARDLTSQGRSLAESLETVKKYFPKLLISLIKVGERSGKLEEELFNLARIYEDETDRKTKNLTTVIEPLLLVLIGLVVGGLALSIITPIYKITGNIYG